MNDLSSMPDTRMFWKSKVHRFVRERGTVHYDTIKEAFPDLENPTNRKTKWVTLKSFLDSKWFKRDKLGNYLANRVWHDSRFHGENGRRRKDDIEYAICSLLQQKPNLTTMGIRESIQLRSNREPHATHISRICQLSRYIMMNKDMWSFNYGQTDYSESV